MDPGNLDSLMNLAAIAESRGEFDAAGKWYRRILEKQPEHPETLKRYARLASRAEPGAAETMSIMERACRANPGDAGCVLALSALYEQTSRYDDAAALYRNAARLNPRFVRIAEQKLQRLAPPFTRKRH
jgi:tetratricopeptide (TPR) repeat protein